MATERRFVLDTNVVVSALLLKKSVTRQAFDRTIQQGKILLSAQTLSEINDVLRRPGFDRYVSEDERMQFLTLLIQETLLIEITETVTECRDEKDNRFLELALSGRATCIISGDKDLLALHPFRGIPILSPRAFLDL